MFKKIEIWILYLFLILFLILILMFGAILNHHFNGGERFPKIQKYVVLFSQIPGTFEKIINKKSIKFDSISPFKNWENKNKENFYSPSSYDGFFILSRYDGDQKKSIVEIRDIKTLKILHTYSHNINKMYDLLESQKVFFDRANINGIEERFSYQNPFIDSDLNLYAIGNGHIFFKIDKCSNLLFANDKTLVHHSINLNGSNNFLIPSKIPKPFSKYSKKFKKGNFDDDAVSIIDQNGEKLYEKSVIEILIENRILGENLFSSDDPIHLNDIEEFQTDSQFWEKGDLLLSARNLSAIIHYRPSSNSVINFIHSEKLSQIHDVEILNDHQIYFFHNNNNLLDDKKRSEVIIYNFQNKTFKNYLDKNLRANSMYSHTGGLSKILPDGSLIVEETNSGRVLHFNKNKELVWEFINLDKYNRSYEIHWLRVLKDKKTINALKDMSYSCS